MVCNIISFLAPLFNQFSKTLNHVKMITYLSQSYYMSLNKNLWYYLWYFFINYSSSTIHFYSRHIIC
jgi:hypothetical protein